MFVISCLIDDRMVFHDHTLTTHIGTGAYIKLGTYVPMYIMYICTYVEENHVYDMYHTTIYYGVCYVNYVQYLEELVS